MSFESVHHIDVVFVHGDELLTVVAEFQTGERHDGAVLLGDGKGRERSCDVTGGMCEKCEMDGGP